MEFFKKMFKSSSCGCLKNKTHKHSSNNKRSSKNKRSRKMRGGYQFSLRKNSADKLVGLSSHRLSKKSKKHSKSHQHSKSH